MKAGQRVRFKEEKVLMETTFLLVQGSNQRGLGGRSNGSQTANSFKVQMKLSSNVRDVLAAGAGLFLVIPDCRLYFLSALVCSSELIEESLWAIMTHYDSFMSLLKFCVGTTA